jgi:hypothetical protein
MPFSRSQSILDAAQPDERACRRTSRTCGVRVHEQIRRNTGPAERVHPGSPETKPAEGRHANISVSRGYRTRPASPSNPTKRPAADQARQCMLGCLSPNDGRTTPRGGRLTTSTNRTGRSTRSACVALSSTGMFCLLYEPFGRSAVGGDGAAIVVGQSPAVARDHHRVPSTGQSRTKFPVIAGGSVNSPAGPRRLLGGAGHVRDV